MVIFIGSLSCTCLIIISTPSDPDPHIPAYWVAGIIILIVVVAVVFSVWCYHKYKLKCVSPSVRDDPGGDNPPNQGINNFNQNCVHIIITLIIICCAVGNPIVAIPMENRGAAGARGIDTDGRRQSSPSQEKSQDAVRLTSHSYVLP